MASTDPASIQETRTATMASVDPAFAGIVCASNFKYIDVIDLTGPLAPILTQRVINIYVVFTQSRDIKPHAELTLEIESAVPLGCLPPGWLPIKTKTIVLGMNSHLLTTYDNFGSSITLSTPYLHGAHLCSLRFDVAKKRRSVKEYLQILRRDRGHDLGTFVNGRNYEIGSGVRAKTMGSRDFVTQCMIRWARNSMINLKKVVEYEVAGQLMAPKPPFHFFDLITKPHRIEGGIIRWDGPQIPMEMGIYEGRVTKDFEKYYAPTNTSVDLSGGIPNASRFSTALADQPINEFLKKIPIQLYPLTVTPIPSGPLPVLPVQVYLLVPLRPGNRSLPLKEFQTSETQQTFTGFQGETEQAQTEPYQALQGQMGQGEMRYQAPQPYQGSQGQTGFQWQPAYEGHQGSQQQ